MIRKCTYGKVYIRPATKMYYRGCSVILMLCVCWVVARHGTWIECGDCNNVQDPSGCLYTSQCPSGELCSVELFSGASISWTFSCRKHSDCSYFDHREGYSHGHNGHHPHYTGLLYSECCDWDMCNTQLGLNYMARPVMQTTPHPASITPSTNKPTVNQTASLVFSTTASRGTSHGFPCIDLETSLVNCTDIKVHGHCANIPGTLYETAKLRCRKTCGFCH